MKLWSDSWVNGERIPNRFAAGRPDAASGVTFSDNVNPHLAWSEAPAATESFVLICHDFDVPSRGDDVNQPDREVPADLPRVDFFHWVLVDLPGSVGRIDEGAFSRGFTTRGKAGPSVDVAGFTGARQGLNDYTGWFASNADMAGNYFGYDGPFHRSTTRSFTTTCSPCMRCRLRARQSKARSPVHRFARRSTPTYSQRPRTQAPTR